MVWKAENLSQEEQGLLNSLSAKEPWKHMKWMIENVPNRITGTPQCTMQAEYLQKILEGYGLGTVAAWYAAAEEGAQDAGEMAADKIVSFVAPLESCESLKEKERASKEGYKTTTGLEQAFWGTNLIFIQELLKQKKCVEYGAVTVG